jgi:hypothetical protein
VIRSGDRLAVSIENFEAINQKYGRQGERGRQEKRRASVPEAARAGRG